VTGRRKLLSAPERSASILAAAARVFATGGYAATTVDEIAAAAGINKLIVYRHFASKHALYLAVLDRNGAELATVERPAPPAAGATHQELIAAAAASLAGYLRAARAQPDAFRLLVSHAQREPEFADHARRLLQRGVAGSEEYLGMIGDPVRRRWAAVTIGAAVDAAVLAWLDVADGTEHAMDVEDTALRLARMIGAIGASAM
jgi:AcrR family transcriptional regulator